MRDVVKTVELVKRLLEGEQQRVGHEVQSLEVATGSVVVHQKVVQQVLARLGHWGLTSLSCFTVVVRSRSILTICLLSSLRPQSFGSLNSLCSFRSNYLEGLRNQHSVYRFSVLFAQ